MSKYELAVVVNAIESRMRIMDNVIRYLCVKKDEA